MATTSPVRRFRKRPVIISAIRWTGDNEEAVREFADGLFNAFDPEGGNPETLTLKRLADPDITAEVLDRLHSTWVGVKTGQWVVRGVKGELYPLDDEVRLETYDPADKPETLTDIIHVALCGNPGCRHYTPGNPHYGYYQDRAKALTEALAPQIGHANVLPVVRAVLDELI